MHAAKAAPAASFLVERCMTALDALARLKRKGGRLTAEELYCFRALLVDARGLRGIFTEPLARVVGIAAPDGEFPRGVEQLTASRYHGAPARLCGPGGSIDKSLLRHAELQLQSMRIQAERAHDRALNDATRTGDEKPPVFPDERYWDVLCTLDKASAGLSLDEVASRAQVGKTTATLILEALAPIYVEDLKPRWKITPAGQAAVQQRQQNRTETDPEPKRD